MAVPWCWPQLPTLGEIGGELEHLNPERSIREIARYAVSVARAQASQNEPVSFVDLIPRELSL